MGKFLKEIGALTWTLAGTGLVLICLQGRTLRLGLWITGVALAVHFVIVLTNGDENP